MDTIEQLEKRLWGAADLLRANSNLNSSEYMMPVLGINVWLWSDQRCMPLSYTQPEVAARAERMFTFVFARYDGWRWKCDLRLLR